MKKIFNVCVQQTVYYLGTVTAESKQEATNIVRDKLQYGYEDILRMSDTFDEELIIEEATLPQLTYLGPDLSEDTV
jgi:hypothetical protein